MESSCLFRDVFPGYGPLSAQLSASFSPPPVSRQWGHRSACPAGGLLHVSVDGAAGAASFGRAHGGGNPDVFRPFFYACLCRACGKPLRHDLGAVDFHGCGRDGWAAVFAVGAAGDLGRDDADSYLAIPVRVLYGPDRRDLQFGPSACR